MKATAEQLDTFATALDGAIQAPGEYGLNDGRLTRPYNRDNWRTATFTTPAPELSAAIRPHAPFNPGEPVSVSLRHHFDSRNDDFVYWVTSLDKEGLSDARGHAINLTAISWLHRNDPRYFIQSDRAYDLREEQFTTLSADLLRTRLPGIDDLLADMSVKDALALAALELRTQPLNEKLTKTMGVKTARNSASSNGFHLEAYRFDHESVAKGSYSLAVAAIRWTFRAELYEGLCDGIFIKKLEVKQQDGLPTTATKTSEISLMNNPYINKDGSLGAYADTFGSSDTTPKPLQHLLYSDNEVAPSDLEYFLGLSTQPLQDSDIELSIKD